MILLILSELQI